MLRVFEGKRAHGKILLEQEVESWQEARPLALRVAAQSVDFPVTIEYGNLCQVVTLSKSEAKKILDS